MFEVVRFGRPLSSYQGLGFTHALLDGLWRLLVGSNKGLLLYFPLLVAAVFGSARLMRRQGQRLLGVAMAGTCAALLLLAAGWWAWDGTVGWGPRLLAPAIPILAAGAGVVATATLEAVLGLTLLALGVAVNALGVLQSEAAAFAYLSSTPPVAIQKDSPALPANLVRALPDGRRLAPRNLLVAGDASFSPLRVHLFLIRSRHGSAEEIARRLAEPPWLDRHPDARPTLPPSSATYYLRSPVSWPHLLADLSPGDGERAASFERAYDEALADQVIRAFDTARPERALALSEKLYGLSPSAYAAALRAEALRASRRLADLASFLSTLPDRWRAAPHLLLVQALVARDLGDEAGARAALASARRALAGPELDRALAAPLDAWPAGLSGFLGE